MSCVTLQVRTLTERKQLSIGSSYMGIVLQYSVPSEYDHLLDPSQIILFKGTIEFRRLSGSSREWSYSEGTL